MGCDIHVYKEKLIDGKWVTADEWETLEHGQEAGVCYEKRAYTGRNYELFGLIAGVRRESDDSIAPRGLPWDVSKEVKEEFRNWGADAHTPSYLYLHELISLRAWCDEQKTTISGMKDKDELATLKASIASGKPDWELLYPYCGWTNNKNSEEFEIDVPLSFVVGEALDEMIAAFQGVDGRNHRLVFWFDN